ncbi:hypothetical protein PHLGIDRAFT_161711 [Phlebiopsis gigantea 11061_1 CR5-6]|uniref:Uncharacterized protein n=1 Tax=Phlebiopsis gigantea (strain 11061_1 CR5-6) TaxID=745531 RepID=A0A0C3PHH1_PHLG1|nr:hypothetical protein PHLGIDRAFT_161711 [Phlebiopsis gigantea 11061_1 CR5-6]
MPQFGSEPWSEPRTSEPNPRFGLGSRAVRRGSPAVRSWVHRCWLVTEPGPNWFEP